MIVLNTLNGSVSTHALPGATNVTPKYVATSTGLYAIGGDTDNGAPIVADVRTPVSANGDTLRKLLKAAYIKIDGHQPAVFTVYTEKASWDYKLFVKEDGISRATLGRGIRDNLLGFGVRTPAGGDFVLHLIEIMMESSTQRRA